MTDFVRPATRDWDYPDIAREAGFAALHDADIRYDDVEVLAAANVHGEPCAGHRAAYELGLSGTPVYAVNSNCSSGSTALSLARDLVKRGSADCALALGFERMQRGSLTLAAGLPGQENPLQRHQDLMRATYPERDSPPAVQMFANAARSYMDEYGLSPTTLARVAEKNHRHATRNPRAQSQSGYSLAEILASPLVDDPLTRLQCCPTSDGGAAAVIASEQFVDEHELWPSAVEISGQAMATDLPESFDGSDRGIVGWYMSKRAATQAYEEAQSGPEDAQVIELHDCFTPAELLAYEALGLCAEGEAGALVDGGATTYGGQWVVNPSGGLIAKGHPLAATGLAQCAELTWQLRGQAGARQVAGASVAIQHNLGLGGAAIVTVYRRYMP